MDLSLSLYLPLFHFPDLQSESRGVLSRPGSLFRAPRGYFTYPRVISSHFIARRLNDCLNEHRDILCVLVAAPRGTALNANPAELVRSCQLDRDADRGVGVTSRWIPCPRPHARGQIVKTRRASAVKGLNIDAGPAAFAVYRACDN